MDFARSYPAVLARGMSQLTTPSASPYSFAPSAGQSMDIECRSTAENADAEPTKNDRSQPTGDQSDLLQGSTSKPDSGAAKPSRMTTPSTSSRSLVMSASQPMELEHAATGDDIAGSTTMESQPTAAGHSLETARERDESLQPATAVTRKNTSDRTACLSPAVSAEWCAHAFVYPTFPAHARDYFRVARGGHAAWRTPRRAVLPSSPSSPEAEGSSGDARASQEVDVDRAALRDSLTAAKIAGRQPFGVRVASYEGNSNTARVGGGGGGGRGKVPQDPAVVHHASSVTGLEPGAGWDIINPPDGSGISLPEWSMLSPTVRASIAKQSAEACALHRTATLTSVTNAALAARLEGRLFGPGQGEGIRPRGSTGADSGKGDAPPPREVSFGLVAAKTATATQPRDARKELSAEQREERHRQVTTHIMVLEHTVECSDASCQTPNCDRMKNLLAHQGNCVVGGARGGCSVCTRLSALIQLHARKCKKRGRCAVPHCLSFRHHMRDTQRQRRCQEQSQEDQTAQRKKRPHAAATSDLKTNEEEDDTR